MTASKAASCRTLQPPSALPEARFARYTPRMERVVRIFNSHAEAEAADRAFYAAMSPQERLDMLLPMQERYRESLGDAGSRFERTCRIVPLSKS